MAEYRPFEPLGDFVDGRFALPAHPAGEIALEDPGDLAAGLGAFPFAPEALDEAVAAARRAFPGWSALPAVERARFMLDIAARIEGDLEIYARAESVDTGTDPIGPHGRHPAGRLEPAFLRGGDPAHGLRSIPDR